MGGVGYWGIWGGWGIWGTWELRREKREVQLGSRPLGTPRLITSWRLEDAPSKQSFKLIFKLTFKLVE